MSKVIRVPDTVNRTCQNCGNIFSIKASMLKWNPAKFCSESCRSIYNGKNLPKFCSNEQLADLYENQKLSGVAIAKMFGVTPKAVAYRLRRMGIKSRPNTFTQLANENAKVNHVKGENHPFHKDIPVDELVRRYEAGDTTTYLAAKHRVAPITISRKLRERGVVIRQAGYSEWVVAKDGHKVQSHFELIVDDWLSDHGISHTTQPKLPFGRNTRADFLIEDTFVEILGLISSKHYRDKYKIKRQKYEDFGLKVIFIYPRAIENEDFSAFDPFLTR